MGVGERKGRRGASEAGRRREEDMWYNQRTGNYLENGGQCVESAERNNDEPGEKV